MKEKDSKSKIVIEVIIILLTIIIAFFTGFTVSRYVFFENDWCYNFDSVAYEDYLKNEKEKLDDIEGTELEYGKYFLSTNSNENTEENTPENIGFQFNEENTVYVLESGEKYAEGEFQVVDNRMVCMMSSVYEDLDDEEGTETDSEIVLEIVNDETVRISEINTDENYGETSHVVGNEYTYDVLENNK